MINGRILLAGASGAVGKRLCPLLVSDGWELLGMTRTPEKVSLLRNLGVEPRVVDVFDNATLMATHKRMAKSPV